MKTLSKAEEYVISSRRISGTHAEKLDQIDQAIQELLDIKLLECAADQPNVRFLAVPRRSHWFAMTMVMLAMLALLILLVGVRPVHAQKAGQNASRPEIPAQAGAAEDPSASASQSATTPPQGAAPETKPEPFAFADFTWLTGNPRAKESPLDTKVFTGEFRVDTAFTYSFNRPQDNTISGSSEVFRSGELQVTQLGIGGDFHHDRVRGRLMTQFGMYSQTTPRNDASPARGQWNLDNAYRYISEAYGGYHWDKMHGINVDAGIFMSYIGLDSYYQYDNWSYQPSYVSSNTPWFFNGLRVQFFPTDKLKIEPWIVNGWQSYGKFNKAPGAGGQMLWRPNGSVSIVANNYWGTDTLGNSDRKRVHTDDSIQVKYYDRPEATVSKSAFTFTFDAGCEYGGGVSCGGGTAAAPSQTFLGFMVHHRTWFKKDRYAVTEGVGAINNPGRYLVLMPPINGATAFSGTPYFTAAPGDPYKAWDASLTFDYMPSQFITFRFEGNHRAANVPYFAGAGGVTPPGGNVGAPGSVVPGWSPDLRKTENRVTFAILVKM
jgi:Putative beta-barrel porin-2, OmpL-like. bbp2